VSEASVAVVIPALDEEEALGAVLAELPRRGSAEAGGTGPDAPSARPGFHVREVVVVDNGSTDRTAEVARAAGATVIREPRRGYGAACLAGLAHLRRSPPEIVVFLDADHSDDPRQLGDLLAAAGDTGEAQARWRDALAIFTDLRLPAAAEIRDLLMPRAGDP